MGFLEHSSHPVTLPPEVSPLILEGRELLNTRPLLESMADSLDLPTLFLEPSSHPVMLPPEVSPLILEGRELLNTRPLLESIMGFADPPTLFLETLSHPVRQPPEKLAFILLKARELLLLFFLELLDILNFRY